jgi:hypothetical protein
MATKRRKPHDWTIEQVQMAKVIIELMDDVVRDNDRIDGSQSLIIARLVNAERQYKGIEDWVGSLDEQLRYRSSEIVSLKDSVHGMNAKIEWLFLPWYVRYWRTTMRLLGGMYAF